MKRTQEIEIEIARSPEPAMILGTLVVFRRFHRRLKRALEA